MTWATCVPILVFLGLPVLELFQTYATDRRQTKASLNASALVARGIIDVIDVLVSHSDGRIVTIRESNICFINYCTKLVYNPSSSVLFMFFLNVYVHFFFFFLGHVA